jgi:hypothetical protein
VARNGIDIVQRVAIYDSSVCWLSVSAYFCSEEDGKVERLEVRTKRTEDHVFVSGHGSHLVLVLAECRSVGCSVRSGSANHLFFYEVRSPKSGAFVGYEQEEANNCNHPVIWFSRA